MRSMLKNVNIFLDHNSTSATKYFSLSSLKKTILEKKSEMGYNFYIYRILHTTFKLYVVNFNICSINPFFSTFIPFCKIKNKRTPIFMFRHSHIV